MIEKDLLDHQAVIGLSQEILPKAWFIYFLIYKNKVVYVGKTTNIYKRIGDHQADREKKFNRFSYIKCKESEVDELEILYAIKFNPIHNKKFDSGTKTNWWNFTTITKYYGLSQWKIWKLLRKEKMKVVMNHIDIDEFDAKFKLKRRTEIEIQQYNERARQSSLAAARMTHAGRYSDF